MTCEGCESAPTPIGKPDGSVFLKALARSVIQTPDGLKTVSGVLSPEYVEVLNLCRSLQVEIAALIAALMKRAILTEKEMNESRVNVVGAMDREFHQQVAQLGRQFAQRPTVQAPTDPRRAP